VTLKPLFIPERGTVARYLLRQLAESPEEKPCAGDKELWWATGNADIALAKQFCKAHCPLIDICLQYAIEAHEKEGVWGGTSAWERSAIFSRMAKARRREREVAARKAARLEKSMERETAS
jgi:WhiB family redox-sensing transcriptional regulator